MSAIKRETETETEREHNTQMCNRRYLAGGPRFAELGQDVDLEAVLIATEGARVEEVTDVQDDLRGTIRGARRGGRGWRRREHGDKEDVHRVAW
jgi:hypothetical protein